MIFIKVMDGKILWMVGILKVNTFFTVCQQCGTLILASSHPDMCNTNGFVITFNA